METNLSDEENTRLETEQAERRGRVTDLKSTTTPVSNNNIVSALDK